VNKAQFVKEVLINLADISLSCLLRHPDAASFFKLFINPSLIPDIEVSVPDRLATIYQKENSSVTFTAADEYFLLHLPVSTALLEFARVLFHGTAFLWHEKAWIFSAPSGTGKTTQFRRWRKLFNDEVKIINGDKPILEFQEDNTIMVHPSPWKGKERWGSMIKAPLGGIIYLEQGKENTIERMSFEDAVIPLYKQFLFLPEKVELIHNVCQMEEVLLRNIPVWKLINRGDMDSAQLTHDTLLKYLEV